MSYSRWCESRWYTFWAHRDDETRDNALFEVDCCVSLTAKELRDDIEGCLDKVALEVAAGKNKGWTFGLVSDDERDELRGYMREFIADVDREYQAADKTGG